MVEANYSLELSESVLPEHRNPKQTEEVMELGLSKDASSSGASTKSVRIESRLCSKHTTAW